MCGLAGRYSNEKFNLKELQTVLEEIGIRGLHSTGVSYLSEGLIVTKIEPIPYYKFVLPDVETNAAILHCRYSTSNIDYPQPVFNSEKAVAHNGVITQKNFDLWEEEYGYKGTDRCDSALLLSSKSPLEDFPDASIAAVELNKTYLSFYRNHQRPLYWKQRGDYDVTIASTESALPGSEMCVPGHLYRADKEGLIEIHLTETKKDLQNYV